MITQCLHDEMLRLQGLLQRPHGADLHWLADTAVGLPWFLLPPERPLCLLHYSLLSSLVHGQSLAPNALPLAPARMLQTSTGGGRLADAAVGQVVGVTAAPMACPCAYAWNRLGLREMFPTPSLSVVVWPFAAGHDCRNQ